MRLTSRQRMTKAVPGPWGASDGPVAGGTPRPGPPISGDEMGAAGFSHVTVSDTGASVDSAFPDEDDLPTLGGGGMGTYVAAGRLHRGLPS